MQKLLRDLKPDKLEDIIALVALYRPGPLGSGMTDEYVRRKHGLSAPKYPHPRLEPILNNPKPDVTTLRYAASESSMAWRTASFIRESPVMYQRKM